jgi:uncharacterized protein
MDLALIFIAALGAGVINAIAGGGTLLTFPLLIFLGRDPILANATSSVALWTGSITGALGFRRNLSQTKRWLFLLMLPSLLGGTIGAFLLLETPPEIFDRLVPLLILTATVLLAIQDRVSRKITDIHLDRPSRIRLSVALFVQFLIALYGGYFGAGIGILMLAALGLIGMSDMHQMNGLKNLLAACIKGIATVYFIALGAILWMDAGVLAAGALLGGWIGPRIAHRVGRANVRRIVIATGLFITIAMIVRLL